MEEHVEIRAVAPRVQYVGDGTQVEFPFPFAIFAEPDLEVWLDAARQAAGFAVAGAGSSDGGTVSFAVPPPPGTLVTLRRRLAIQRTSDFQEAGPLRAKVLNDELDYQTAALQQVADEAALALRRAATSASAADLTLPEPVAGRALKWTADASGLENSAADPDQQVALSAGYAAAALARLGEAEAARDEAVAAKIAAQAAREDAAAAAASVDLPAVAFGDDGKALVAGAGGWALSAGPLGAAAYLDTADDRTARDIAMVALITASSTGGIRGPVVSWVANADHFATGTGATFSTDHYHNAGGSPSYTVSIAYDGVNAVSLSGSGYIAQSFQVPTTDPITAVQVHHYASSGGNFDVTIETDDAGAPSGTRLAESTNKSIAGSGFQTYDLPDFTPATGTTYWLVVRNNSGSALSNCWGRSGDVYANGAAHRNGAAQGFDMACKVQQTPGPSDMTLSDDPETIAADPDVVDVYVVEKAIDAGPTRRLRASIDGGASWATGTLADGFSFGDRQLYRYECDVSGQAGSSLKVEYSTLADGKERNVYRLDAVPLYA